MAIARPTPPAFGWAAPWLTIGVTGTNGKTSTTHMIAHVLRAAGVRTFATTSMGTTIDGEAQPDPATLRALYDLLEAAHRRGVRHAAIEVTSRALADGYAKRWRFDLGVFTNLSPDHFATHGSWENYLAAKAQLFVHLGPGCTAVLNAGDEASLLLDQAIPEDVTRRWFHAPARGGVRHAPVDLQAIAVSIGLTGTDVELAPSELATQLGGRLAVPLVGEVFAENALAAATACLAIGIPGDAIVSALATCPGVRGRFEILHADPVVAVDYAHSPDALARTCDTARVLATVTDEVRGRVIVVFGAGGESSPDKREPMGEAVGARADVAILTADNPRREDPAAIAATLAVGCHAGGRAIVRTELDRKRAIELALGEARAGDVVVIAGRGAETVQQVGDEARELDDAAIVRAWIGARA